MFHLMFIANGIVTFVPLFPLLPFLRERRLCVRLLRSLPHRLLSGRILGMP